MAKVLIFLSLIFFGWITSAHADDKFYSKHDVKYSYSDLGQAQVSHSISLTNKQTGYYASNYSLTLIGDSPGVVSGHDGVGPLVIKIQTLDPETTVVNIAFNQQVAGRDQTLRFSLNYTGHPASHNGQVWEINLPRVASSDKIDDFNLELAIPESYGKLAFISPSPSRHAGNSYFFTKDQIDNIGVVAAFGNFQTFDFTLNYQLTNPNIKLAKGEIALPADTTYQRLNYQSLDPSPEQLRVDADGNWLASYLVKPDQSLAVIATGQVHLLAEPTKRLAVSDLSLGQKYLEPTSYWPTQNSQIVALAQKLKTPKAIYRYVVDTLSYDFERAPEASTNRKGALGALASPQASVCTEFTDLFITLARATGIPAREVEGYAYTTDTKLRPLSLSDNVFHAWPQYWDSLTSQWVSVDPTWGDTTGGVDYFSKLDFNHFAFVTHGVSDTQPSLSAKSAQVKFGVYHEFLPASATATWQPPRLFFPRGANSGQLTITNPSGQAIYNIPVRLSAKNASLTSTPNIDIAVLPPFATQTIPVSFAVPWLPQFAPKGLTVYLGNATATYNIPESLFLVWEISLGIIIATIITIMGVIATKAWGVYLQRHRGSGAVHR